MLNQIRNLSKHPVILTMMGMLIFVFVLFFGLPGQMGDSGINLFSQWSARVGDETLNVSDAMLYARRRSRSSDDMSPLKQRIDEMISEELIDQAAEQMGWVSTYEQERSYIASAQNHDVVYFSDDLRRDADIEQAFLATLPAGSKVEDLSTEQLSNAYLAFVRRSFKGERAQETIDGWGLNTEQYIKAKGRELRVRGYLKLLKGALKVSDLEAREAFKRDSESWSFEVVSVGAEHVAPSTEAPSAEVVEAFLKDKPGEVESYYKANIGDYSKTKLKFTRVSARYSGEAQQAQAEAKIKELRDAVAQGQDPEALAKSLSTPELAISAFVMSNKTRANTSEKLFNELAALKAGELSEVTHTDNTFVFPGMNAKQPKSGTYTFARLEELEAGEERTLEQAKSEIAALLIEKAGRAARAEELAKKVHAAVQGGQSLSDAATALSAEGAESPLAVGESAALKVGMMLEGNLEGVGRDAAAGEALVGQLNKLNAAGDLAAAPLKVGAQWVVFALKSHEAPDANAFETQKAQLLSDAQGAEAGRFFGLRWLQYALLSPSPAPTLPRQVIMALQQELTPAFATGREGFLDKLLNSSYFQKIVERNDAVERALAQR